MSQTAEQNQVRERAIWIGLLAAIYAVYSQTADFDFISLGDPQYVYENGHVLAGLSRDGIQWAFGAAVAGQWAPLTLLSHMLGAQMFGLRSGMHHFLNVVLHMAASLLLYAALKRATGARWPGAFVAFGFALHPLQVESVAWVAERKNVLGALFWFAGIYLYVRYCERPSRWRYLAVAAAFAAGLFSTPMMVTFPLALLLLDLWPLRRMEWPRAASEKLPLLALSGIAAMVAYGARGAAALRVGSVFVSYVTYLRQIAWPAHLAVIYPDQLSIPAWHAAAAFATVAAISVLAARQRRPRPWLTVGWFWFLVTLAPALAFSQHAFSQHAFSQHPDRYIYIPLTGLLLAAAWSAQEAIDKWPLTRWPAAIAALACCAAWLMLAHTQTSSWASSETVFLQAIRATDANPAAEFRLAEYYGATTHFAAAIPHYEAALRVRPDAAAIQAGLGTALLRTGNFAAAIPHFEAAVRVQPENGDWQYGLGQALFSEGRTAASIAPFDAAVRAKPQSVAAHYYRGVAVATAAKDRIPALTAEYESALRENPEAAAAHAGLGGLLAGLGQSQKALGHVDTALEIQPSGELQKVLEHLRESLQ